MSFVEWWNSLGLASQILHCIAVPATLVLLVQTILMLLGLDDNADGLIDSDLSDLELDDVTIGDDTDVSDMAGLESLHLLTVRGIISFFVIFGWVGIVMLGANINLAISLGVATICGLAMMVAIAYLFKLIMKLKCNGVADNRNALGTAGKVYLTIPPSRKGEGKVNVMLQGAYVERNAVTDETDAIPTGSEIIVVGVSGQTSLVVKRK